MTDRNQLKDRARDELFSHINRCGVLQAAHEDQEHWLAIARGRDEKEEDSGEGETVTAGAEDTAAS
jgi:hypothetical protein